jgi:hypothetical protein
LIASSNSLQNCDIWVSLNVSKLDPTLRKSMGFLKERREKSEMKLKGGS